MSSASGRLRQLLGAGETLVMPDAYDALSARIIERCGFAAVQCSGASIAIAACLKDEAQLTLAQNLQATRQIVSAVSVPVMADGEDGYGGPEVVGDTIRKFIVAGVGGINIEDQIIGASGGVKVVDASLMVEKIMAAREAARAAGDPTLILNARTDALKAMGDHAAGLREAIRRASLYLQAGADLTYIAYAATLEDVKTAVAEVHGPISITAGQAYNMSEVSIEALRQLGVARVSLPTLAILASVGTLSQVMREVRRTGRFEGVLAHHTLASWNDVCDLLRQ